MNIVNKLRIYLILAINIIARISLFIREFLQTISFTKQTNIGECTYVSITTLNGVKYNYLVHKKYNREVAIISDEDQVFFKKIDNSLYLTPKQLGLYGDCIVHIDKDTKIKLSENELIDG